MTDRCRAKDRSKCPVHGIKATSAPVLEKKPLTIAEQIAANFAAREAEKKAVFKQEWAERSTDWKEYGFQYPVSKRICDDPGSLWNQSQKELADASEHQILALRFFSSNNFKWINSSLYTKESLPVGDTSSRTLDSYKIESLAKQEIEANPTQALAGEVVASLDSLLSKEREESRILYRGQSRKTYTAMGSSTKDLHSYVDNHYKVGQEVSMDGYLSTSPSASVALGYSSYEDSMGSKQEGIFYEMKTKKGVNITSASLYGRESETLLPRNTKWKVAAVHKSKSIQIETKTVTGIKKSVGKVTLIQLVEVV